MQSCRVCLGRSTFSGMAGFFRLLTSSEQASSPKAPTFGGTVPGSRASGSYLLQGIFVQMSQYPLDEYRMFDAGYDLDSATAFTARLVSMLRTRCSRCAHVIAARCVMAVFGALVEQTLSAMTAFSGILALQDYWLNGESGSVFLFK